MKVILNGQLATQKQLKRKLIKMQNEYGKKIGRAAWQLWMKANAVK